MRGCAGIPPDLDMTWLLYVILGVAAGLKVILYLYCVALQKQSESMLALAEDHRNDIMSNVVAILTGAAASYWREGWWIDPVGGILISMYIIYSWGAICKEQVNCIAAAHQNVLRLAVSLHQSGVYGMPFCAKAYLLKTTCILLAATESNAPMVPYQRGHGACIYYFIMQTAFL